ncbi:MAG: GNAT family N-acetyltransferase [Defluviitaleaceae bacterium]|nr:GNAT family N-acetyltransferase [Defluviitaleaceae bacterium]
MISTKFILGINEADLTEVRAIRQQVFCEEQQIDQSIEIDGLDASAIHILASFNDTPAATGRLLVMNNQFIIGRVAVLSEFRGKRLGDLVVRLLIRMAYDMDGRQQWIHAQLPVRGFYEKLGFTPVGDIYEEAGIPHITMVHEGDVTGTCKHTNGGNN